MWMIPLTLASMLNVATTDASAADLTYLALGDSYTIGEGLRAPERWPLQLAARLRADGIALGDPEIIARTGWTTDELAAALDGARLAGPYDLVSLLIGVNNQFRGRSADNYQAEFAALLERAIALAGDRPQRVLVLSFPDWGVTQFGQDSGRDLERVARETDAFNTIAKTECAKRGVAYVDVAPASRVAAAATAMLAEDGLHPSARQYALWVDLALPVARRLLDSRL